MHKTLKLRSMPKVELGTFRVVAGEELKIEIKNLAVGVLFASLACCGSRTGPSARQKTENLRLSSAKTTWL
jgi:hypothetical protein